MKICCPAVFFHSFESRWGRGSHSHTDPEPTLIKVVERLVQSLKVVPESVWLGTGGRTLTLTIPCVYKNCWLTLIGMVVFTDKKCSHTESGSFTLRRNIQLKQWCQSKGKLKKVLWSGVAHRAVAGTRCWSTVLFSRSLDQVFWNWKDWNLYTSRDGLKNFFWKKKKVQIWEKYWGLNSPPRRGDVII